MKYNLKRLFTFVYIYGAARTKLNKFTYVYIILTLIHYPLTTHYIFHKVKKKRIIYT